MIGEPPSLSEGSHWIVKEVSVIPDTSNGPRGGEGLSVEESMLEHE